MNRIICCSGILLLVLAISFGALAQGLHVESQSTGGPIGNGKEEMWLMPKMMKMVRSQTGETVIIRLDKELFITVDPDKKTYSEMTFAEMEGMMKKAGGAMEAKMAEMKKRLADMPEDQRKMVEQMMENKMGLAGKDEKIDVEKSPDTKKISGYNCRKYVITRDGKDFMTVWATKDISGFDVIRKDWEEFSKRMMAMTPMAGKGIGSAYGKIDGFPIQTELGKDMVSTVTKIEKKSTPASDFEPPSGYKKVKPRMMEEQMPHDDSEDK